jgi:general secretion pathway protein J
MKQPHQEAGFTLVEMLVSLAIIAMASIVLIIGIGRMDLRQRLLAQRDARIDEIAQAQFTLRHRIANIHPSINPLTSSTIDFSGTQFSLEFDGEPPDNASPDAFQRYRLRLERGGNLMLYRLNTLNETVDKRQPEVMGWTGTRLLSGVNALSVRYFGPEARRIGGKDAGAGAGPDAGAVQRWQQQWSNRDVLPLLISLRLDFPSGDQRSWPELVVRLRAANGDSCERDPRTDDCKGAV